MAVRLKAGFTRKLRDFGDKGRMYEIFSAYGLRMMVNDGSSICELCAANGDRWELNSNADREYDLDCDDAELEARCHASFVNRGYGESSPWEVVA